LIAFLIFNFQPAKIFMGDTGSLLIGLINSVLIIRFINVSTSPEVSHPIIAAPAVAFSILTIPLLDTLRVFAIRIFNRRSPFSPDRNHIHHLLLDKGLSHKDVTLTLLGANAVIVAVVYNTQPVGCTWLILSIVLAFFTGIGFLYYFQAKPRLFVAKTSPDNRRDTNPSKKIVPLTQDAVLEQK